MSNKRSMGEVFEALEADRELRGLRLLALAVGFEDRTEFVIAGESEGLRKLNRLALHGGEPIGTLALNQHGAVEVKPLPEFDGEAWAFDYLHALTRTFLSTLEAAGIARVAPGGDA